MLHLSDSLVKIKQQQFFAVLLALAVQAAFLGMLSQTAAREWRDRHAASPMLMELHFPTVAVATPEDKPWPELNSSLTQATSSTQKRKLTDNSAALHVSGLKNSPDFTPQQPADVTSLPVAESQESGMLNVETLKVQARSLTRESSAGKRTTNLGQEEASLSGEKMREALAKAARPRCDNDYKAAIGAAKFEGLFKVPFLVTGAVSDKGCKW